MRHGSPWPRHAFLQELGGDRLRVEEELLASTLKKRQVPVTLFTAKRLQRRQLSLDRDCLVAGDGDQINQALRQLGVEPPPPLDYPEVLRPFLKRPIRKSTVGQIRLSMSRGRGPLFAKPAARAKRFTGRVFESHEDLYFLYGASDREPVWCAPPVTWRSEWRAYVLHGRVLALCQYSGVAGLRPDEDTLRVMLETLLSSGSAPVGFALDIGVLEDGSTALVEVNDALALGAYCIAAEDYTDLISARWAQLMGIPCQS